MAERVRVMMERLAMKDAEATWQEIERFDAANSRAMRASFNFDWNDALLYHVVLNSARVPVDACVRAVCELAKEQRFQDDTATKLALADKLLETRVRAALVEHIGSGEMAAITLSAANGKIILEGTTSNGALPARAAKLAREIEGVNDIDNRIVSVPSRGRSPQSRRSCTSRYPSGSVARRCAPGQSSPYSHSGRPSGAMTSLPSHISFAMLAA